jgi:hypothetical protein
MLLPKHPLSGSVAVMMSKIELLRMHQPFVRSTDFAMSFKGPTIQCFVIGGQYAYREHFTQYVGYRVNNW